MIGVFYYFYEAIKHKMTKGKPVSFVDSIVSGSVAGVLVLLTTHPIWMVNVNLSHLGLLHRVLIISFSRQES